MAYLCRISDTGQVLERWEIGGRPLVVGRGDFADIRVRDESLSRRHFLVVRNGNNFVIQDLDSSNGTWVNGEPVAVASLLPNAVICVGQSVFMFDYHPHFDQRAVLLSDTVMIPTIQAAQAAQTAQASSNTAVARAGV